MPARRLKSHPKADGGDHGDGKLQDRTGQFFDHSGTPSSVLATR